MHFNLCLKTSDEVLCNKRYVRRNIKIFDKYNVNENPCITLPECRNDGGSCPHMLQVENNQDLVRKILNFVSKKNEM